MPDYIIKYNDTTQHYFYIPNTGLCVRQKHHNIWQNYKPIYKDCTEIFSVLCDHTGILHAICISPQNELIYLTFKENEWFSHTITRLKENMNVSEIIISENSVGLNIIYTAQYMGEILLVHCILGNNAMPNTLDKLSHSFFFLSKNKIYYTNPEGYLGFRDISDGKPDIFNNLIKNAEMPYILTYNNKDFITYKKENKIYFQNRPVIEDSFAQTPILSFNNQQLLLMWKNNDFIRYIVSADNGNTWSGTMQYVNPGKTPQIYHVVHNGNTKLYFGNHSNTDIHIYGKSDIFEPEPSPKPHSDIPQFDSSQITKLKILLDMQKKEIFELKKEIYHIGQMIKSFSEITCDETQKNSST